MEIVVQWCMVKAQVRLSTEGRSTGHAQNAHKEVVVDRPEEATTVDGVGRLSGRATEMTKFNRELTLCVFAQHSTTRSIAARSQSIDWSTGTRVQTVS